MCIAVPSGSPQQPFECGDIIVHSIPLKFEFVQVTISSFGFRGVSESIGEIGDKFCPKAFVVISVGWLEWGVPGWIPVDLPIHFVDLLSYPVVNVGPLDVG